MGLISRSRRRRWLVDRRHQLRFVALVLAQAVPVALAFGLAALVVSLLFTRSVEAFLTEQDVPVFADTVTGAWRSHLAGVALVVLLSTVFQVLFALHASNRLAGPMLRLRRILAEMAAGNTSQRATFRKRDRLEDLAEPVNRRLVLLDDALSRLKGELPFLASSVQTFRADLENGKYPLDADELRRLEATLGNLAGFWRRGAEPTEP